MMFYKEFKKITTNILNDNRFMLLKNDVHHGTTKYAHCKRVSYLSFLFSKLFKGNVAEVTRAALLHDFFFGERLAKDENSYLKHPFVSAKNAKKYFNVTKDEENTIKSHMYHYALVKKISLLTNEEDRRYLIENKPKGKAGIIVCLSDLLVSIYEVACYKIRYNASLYLLFILNWIRL